jgi:hypothetical protein
MDENIGYTSSLNGTSTVQLGNRLVARGVRRYSVSYSLTEQASGQIFKDDVNGFSSTSDICFMVVTQRVSNRKTARYAVVNFIFCRLDPSSPQAITTVFGSDLSSLLS